MNVVGKPAGAGTEYQNIAECTATFGEDRLYLIQRSLVLVITPAPVTMDVLVISLYALVNRQARPERKE